MVMKPAERAEKMNGRFAMMGFVCAVVSYATSGSVFFFRPLDSDG